MQDRTDSTAYYNHGIANYEKREYAEAIADYTKTVALNLNYTNLLDKVL